jgi:serine/threonine protein kinase/tetratricopeptide (TPR) repeat protein
MPLSAAWAGVTLQSARDPSPCLASDPIVFVSGSPEPDLVIDLLERLRTSLADRYSVQRELGRGGTAIVFLARDLRVDRQVALKVLRPEVAAAVGTERFLREIRVTSELQHPNVLALFDTGEADGCLYYSMPYVAGESLRARLWREGQLPIDEAVRIARQVAHALAYAHSQGVIHRDIKPENILLQAESETWALVADFGIAHALTVAGGEHLTATGVAIGTPAYMSPEQASHGRIDQRSDVYGLGCVLYEMLAGSPPFTGPTAQAVIARHAMDPAPSLRTVRPTVSPALERVVLKALAKVPADRYADATAFEDALRKIGHLEETEVTPVARPRSRRIAVSVGAAGAALAIIGLAAVWANGRATSRVHARDWIVVADFDGPADDPGLANAVRELTTAELNRSSFVSTLPRDQLNTAMQLANIPESTHVGPQLARELAYRSAVRAVVAGGVSRMGGPNYSIVIHVVDAADGADILSVAGAASDSNLVTTVQRLARNVREGLGERRSAVEANLLTTPAATPSFTAYRFYVEAGALHDKGDVAGSNRVLHEALALDTGFASAWYIMGWNYLNDRMLDSARLAFAEALKRPDRLGVPQRYRVEADAAYALRYDLLAAVRACDLYLEQSPSSFNVLNNRGVYLLALGRYEDALRDFKKAVEVHPFGPRQAQIQLANQVGTLIALGRIAEARTAARDLTGAYARYLELALAVAADHWAEADSIASEYSNAPSSPDWLRVQARMTGASALAARGAVSSATDALEHAAEGAPPDFARWYDTGRLLLAGAAERNLAPLPSRAARDTTNAGLVTYGLWEAARGDTTPARQRLDQLRRTPEADRLELGQGPALLEASLAARGGRWADVIRLIGPAAARGEHDATLLDRPNSLALRWLAAEAYARLRMPDSAVAMMELVLQPTRMPGSTYALRGFIYPFAHRRLALWYAALGQHEKATTHWRAFLDAVRTPDAELMPLLREAQQASAATTN